MKRTTRAVLAAAALITCLAGALLSPAVAAAPVQDLDLSGLDRGAAAAVPYLEGTVVVDGTVRVEGPDQTGGLLGKSGDEYLVWAFAGGGAKDRVIRISADGRRELVLRARALHDAVLSPDGTTIATSLVGSSRRTTLKTYDTATGALTSRSTVAGFGSVLDFDGDLVAVGINAPDRTVAWRPATGDLTKVAVDAGYRVDLEADRLAVFTSDPYQGGCTVVSSFSDPQTELWRSCEERVEAWSTDGTRMATVDLLSDGLGSGRVWLRRTGGRILSAYGSPYYFGRVSFEDATHVLLDTYSFSRYAVVRCDGKTCERASKRYPHSPPLRTVRR